MYLLASDNHPPVRIYDELGREFANECVEIDTDAGLARVCDYPDGDGRATLDERGHISTRVVRGKFTVLLGDAEAF